MEANSNYSLKMPAYFITLLLIQLLFATSLLAYSSKPVPKYALWSGVKWGTVYIHSPIAMYGDEILARGVLIGGPASNPWWSCSQYSHWTANGTDSLKIQFPGPWTVPNSVFLQSYNIMEAHESKVAGDPPPDNYSETCYCRITTFGVQGGCESREWQPTLFRIPEWRNPNAGIGRFAVVNSGDGWVPIRAIFSGYAGVGWVDWAIDHIYIIPEHRKRGSKKNASINDLPEVLKEDTDKDGLPDLWELACSPNESLDDFAGGAAENTPTPAAETASEWVNVYAPREAEWVPASINDWDGDGFSNMQEFENWWNGRKDGNGMPFAPTIINHIASSSPFILYMPAIIGGKKSDSKAK